LRRFGDFGRLRGYWQKNDQPCARRLVMIEVEP
jgi:hypothetical protein